MIKACSENKIEFLESKHKPNTRNKRYNYLSKANSKFLIASELKTIRILLFYGEQIQVFMTEHDAMFIFATYP